MERDRAAVLTLRSAVRGVVDYTQAELHNPSWWKHWRYLIRAMDNAEHSNILCRAYEFQLALVSNSRISADDFSASQREAKELFKDIEGSLRPWLGRTKQDRDTKEAEDFRVQWEAIAGFDPQDEEAKEVWANSIRSLTAAKAAERLQAEQAELEQQTNFHQRVKEIRQRRLRQQGR